MKTAGIIGGMGPLATADLFRNIILNTRADTDQDHIHVIIDSNTSIPDRTRHIVGDGEDPAVEIIRSARRLEVAGADFLIMPCNTAHHYFNAIQASVKIPMLNMLEETVRHILDRYGEEATAGLLATDGTIKSRIYDDYFGKTSIRLVRPGETQRYVMEFIYTSIKKGNYNSGTEGFFKAVDELREQGADLFILGCTELSSAHAMFKFEGEFVDPMDILTRRAIEYAGGAVRDDHTKTN